MWKPSDKNALTESQKHAKNKGENIGVKYVYNVYNMYIVYKRMKIQVRTKHCFRTSNYNNQ